MSNYHFNSFAFSMVAERSKSLKSAAKEAVAAFKASNGEALAAAIAALEQFTAENTTPSVTITSDEIVVVTYSRNEEVLSLLKSAVATTAKGQFRGFLGKRVSGSDAWRWTASRAAIEKFAGTELWAASVEVARKIQAAAA